MAALLVPVQAAMLWPSGCSFLDRWQRDGSAAFGVDVKGLRSLGGLTPYLNKPNPSPAESCRNLRSLRVWGGAV